MIIIEKTRAKISPDFQSVVSVESFSHSKGRHHIDRWRNNIPFTGLHYIFNKCQKMTRHFEILLWQMDKLYHEFQTLLNLFSLIPASKTWKGWWSVSLWSYLSFGTPFTKSGHQKLRSMQNMNILSSLTLLVAYRCKTGKG